LNVLVLAPHPDLAAATRFRVTQFVEPLRARGVELHVRPMLDARTFSLLYERGAAGRVAAGVARGALRRVADLLDARSKQVVMVQRDALLFGPPLVEWIIARRLHRPLVLDLDDPYWVDYDSPTYGRVGRWLKWPGKTDHLIRMSTLVTCGNTVIAEHARALGRPTALVPPAVDTDRFTPRSASDRAVPVIGWIGTHSTQPYIAQLLPTLDTLARRRRFEVRLVGARGVESTPNLHVDAVPWTVDREVAEFQNLDVGLYPLPDDEWAVGKAGLKAVQYMAVGRPFVVSAGSAAATLGEPGATHFVASTPDEWRDRIELLLDDPDLRDRMGGAGRRYVMEHLTVDQVADTLAGALHEAAGGSP
jgi:glycosyltransferase involved in cell wall biosynthesis